MALHGASFNVLHLNFECEAKCLSCLHILFPLPQEPHRTPHKSSLQGVVWSF